MTNKEFVAKLINIAKNTKTLYVMGCFGAPMNPFNKKRYTNNHSYNKTADRTAMINAASSDTFGFDCVCLIKGVLWGFSGDPSKTYGGAVYTSNGVPDIGADSMIKVCKDVSTDFSKIEVGEAVWMKGHIGVYVGDGLAVECTPKWENKVQITACNCSKGGYNRRNWTKHGKLPYITYEKVEETPTPTFPTTVKGIDVSKWQSEIDWNKVKADGIKFAMIRLGYGSADGTQCGVDGYFHKNVVNAVKAGIDVGCYFYSYALNVEAAKKEAQFVVDTLKDYKGVFTYPIAFDLEDPKQQSLGKTTLTNMVIAFGDIIEKAGYWCSLYSNLNWLTNILDDSKLTRFDHWVAQWASACTYKNKDITGMWQSSSTGKVNGINGNVDTDVAYKDYPTIIRQNKLNGFTSVSQKPSVPVKDTPSTSEKPVEPEKPSTPTENTYKVGDLVRIVSTNGIKYNSNSAVIPDWVKKETHVVTQIASNGKEVIKGGKKCVLLGKKLNSSNAQVAGINTWVSVDILTPANKTTSAPTYQVYTVKAGDSLWAIAARFLGNGARYEEIKTLNNLTSDTIYVGNVLKIPNK